MIGRALQSYLDQFSRPVPTLAIDYVRWAVCLALSYKLLSGDFAIFVDLPPHLLELYPVDAHDSRYFHLMGVKPLIDLVTLHAVYWFVDLPSASVVSAIQWTTIGFLLAAALFGSGPFRLIPIIAFLLVMHMWGFKLRSHHDLDDVEILQSLLLLYVFSNHREGLTLQRMAPDCRPSLEGGRMYAVFLMAFVIYYFPSGVNKLIDISISDWLAYPYTSILSARMLNNVVGHYEYVLPMFEYLPIIDGANYIAVPPVYISHILTPLILWRRAGIYFFIVFYTALHLLSAGVGIFFFGNILALITLIPVYRLFEKRELVPSPVTT
ncbi:hypothetical protein [Algihabitans albus]|uniref:hypothetical protein n=1 Tax=Algihabitans albus TaxID=2164067 RepID=UPI0013C2B8A3|nr:hypothetical protein [Algihabitans albus]